MVLALLSASFQSLPLLPTVTVGLSGAASRVGGFVYVLGPCGSLQGTLPWGWEFLPLLGVSQPPQVFSISGLRFLFPHMERWVVWSVTRSTSCCLAGQLQLCPPPLHNLPPSWLCQLPPCTESSLPGCPPPPVLPVWMNVSSLSPWLSDFHTVWFSVSSGCFLFLNCCCPFGCARRHSVSTYASILAGNSECGFFKSLIVGLPNSCIFWKFCVIFVL